MRQVYEQLESTGGDFDFSNKLMAMMQQEQVIADQLLRDSATPSPALLDCKLAVDSLFEREMRAQFFQKGQEESGRVQEMAQQQSSARDIFWEDVKNACGTFYGQYNGDTGSETLWEALSSLGHEWAAVLGSASSLGNVRSSLRGSALDDFRQTLARESSDESSAFGDPSLTLLKDLHRAEVEENWADDQ